MKTKILKIVKWVVVGLLGLWVIIMLIGYFFPNGAEQIINFRQKMLLAQYEKALADLEEQKKLDNIGGKTPEETLEMLLTALENKDFNLVYDLHDVDYRFKNFDYVKNLSRDSGEKIDIYINNVRSLIDTGEKYCVSNNKCLFSLVVSKDDANNHYVNYQQGDESNRIEIGMTLSDYTKVWKISR